MQEKKVGLTRIDNPQLKYILPPPDKTGKVTLEKILSERRSHRAYLTDAVSADILSQILWAAYGITRPFTRLPQSKGGMRTAPSAGATYPLEIYVLAGNVKDIEPGVYKYIATGHEIIQTIAGDIKKELSIAAWNQEMIKIAPLCLLYSAVYIRSTQRYSERGQNRYVCMDLGHSAQNVYLQAEALNLGTCAIGAFNDSEVKKIMQLPEEEEPMYIMPVGAYHKTSI
jgi:SagB-type dehydrogenase family enzyme